MASRGRAGLYGRSTRPRVITALVALIVTLQVSPAAGGGDEAWLSDISARTARTTTGDLSVLIHASRSHSLDQAVADARKVGMSIGTHFRSVDVFVAHGSLEQIRAVAALESIGTVEANAPLTYATETSHKATRGIDVLQGKVKAGGRTITGAGVGVAIVDTGVDGTHPDLASNMGGNVKVVCSTVVTSYDREDPNDYGSCVGPVAVIPAPDTDTIGAGGHGTHVAGIVAGDGTASEGRFHGAAPEATLFGVSAGELLFVENAASGLEWVLENHDKVSPKIKVVNASWGSNAGASPSSLPIIWRLQDRLVEEGITVVFVAHNYGGDGTRSRTVQECINPTAGVICVANYDDEDTGTRSGTIAESSSRGAARDPRTWPDLAAPGTSIMSTCRVTLPVCWLGGGHHDDPHNTYSSLGGTSMAAPHVAGIVAQLLQANPRLSPAEIEDILEDTAYKFSFGAAYQQDPANRDGTSSFDKGHGLVDAVAAVRRAAQK